MDVGYENTVMQSTWEDCPFGFMEVDSQGIVCAHNSLASEILGSELLGRLWSGLTPSLFDQRFTEQPYVPLQNGKFVLLKTQPASTGGGQWLFIEDVTALHCHQLLQLKQQALSLRYELTSTLSHQIKTPLTTALIALSHLSNAEDLLEEECVSVQLVKQKLSQIEAITTEYLFLAKGGSLHIEKKRLSSLVEELKDAISTKSDRTPIQLSLNLHNPDKVVALQSSAFMSALDNLFENAIEASAKKIELRMEETERGLQVSISDDGTGIQSQHIPHLFSPFFTTKKNGHGVGLAFVKLVMDAHGGVIQIHPEIQGTRVELHLPFIQIN